LSQFFIDFQGAKIFDITVNQQQSTDFTQFLDHRISFGEETHDLFKLGEKNAISIGFENTYVNNSAGLHKYVDSEDQYTYIFSHCEPFFCHRWFPCFD